MSTQEDGRTVSTKLGRAVEEAGEFLAAFEDGPSAPRDEVDVTLLGAWGYPPLTVGTLRALHALAKDMHDITSAYTLAEVERAAAR